LVGPLGALPPVLLLQLCAIFATLGKSFRPVILQIGFPTPLS